MNRISPVLCLISRLLVVAGLAAGSISGRSAERRVLEYAPAPVDNPLKGLVPYQGDVRDRFPHSLEFNYLPYSVLVKGYEVFDWVPLEALLDEIASRGHQAVFRVFLEYPGKSGVIPPFLLKDGLKVTRWSYSEEASRPGAGLETPDYEDVNLRRSLRNFITALGARYDGDPRLGFITAGLLGIWGEWHNHPRTELSAGKETQETVMAAYEAAFKVTPVLLRYPAGDGNRHYAANATRPFGYHDDSFAWATLSTGRRSDDWFYMPALQSAGPDAVVKWQTQPVGGEIRPEAWGAVFDAEPGRKEIQDFRQCVEATHVSWLMDSGMFRRTASVERVRRAEAEVRRMGYEFHAKAVTLGDVVEGRLAVALEVESRGVAPFYYDWKPEWGFLKDGEEVRRSVGEGSLRGLLPGAAPRVWTHTLDTVGLPAGTYTVAVRVPNALKKGQPVRLANVTQDVVTGWLNLGSVHLP